MILPKISLNSSTSQLIYAIIVVILVPLILAFNTMYLLQLFHKNTDWELNNKALLLDSVLSLSIRNGLDDPQGLKKDLGKIVNEWPEIKDIQVFQAKSNNTLAPLATTSDYTQKVIDPVLNELAWGSNKAYSKQIFNYYNTGNSERVWLVATPIRNDTGQKIGMVNLYMSAGNVDATTREAVRVSIIITMVMMGLVFLLLLNHFRFFEISVLFNRLNKLDQLKDDFISMASHELKAPLIAISSYAYLLLKNPVVEKDKKINKQVSVIFASTERLKILVDEILDVSRIEQKQMRFNMIFNDIAGILDNVVKEFTPLAQSKGLKLSYVRPNFPVVIVCDRDKIHQIFANLVSNAIKYTLQGEITIYHQVKGGNLRTFIKDTGVGMSKEERAKLFTKFYRAYNSKIQNVYGTGLGLWITKQLIEKMGGRVTVDSVQNHGSQFIVSLPLKYPKKEKDLPASVLPPSGVIT